MPPKKEARDKRLSTIVGQVDALIGRHLTGWVRETRYDNPVHLRVIHDGAEIASASISEAYFTILLPCRVVENELQVEAFSDPENVFVLPVRGTGDEAASSIAAIECEVREDWDAASALWQDRLSTVPLSVTRWLGLARVWSHMEKLSFSDRALQVAFVCAEGGEERQAVARAAQQYKRWEVSIRLLGELVLESPSDEGLALDRVEAMINCGLYSRAEAALAVVADHFAPGARAQLLSAMCKKQTSQAEAGFRKVLEAYPKSVKPRVRLVQLLISTRRIEDARALIDQALFDAHPAEYAAMHGEIERAVGRAEVAAASYRRALAINDTNAVALHGLARLALDEHNFEEALKFAKRSLAIQPAMVEARVLVADIDAARGDWYRTFDSLAQVLAVEPGHTKSAVALAALLLNRGAIREAAAVTQKALASNANNFQLVSAQNVARALSGEFAAVLNEVKHSRHFTNTVRVADLIVRICQLSPEPTIHALLSNAVMALWPEVEYAYTIFDKLRRRGDAPEAVIWGMTIVRHSSSKLDAKQWLQLSQTARVADRLHLAAEWIDMAVKLHAGDVYVREKLRGPIPPARRETEFNFLGLHGGGKQKPLYQHLIKLRILAEAGEFEAVDALLANALREFPQNGDLIVLAIEAAVVRGRLDQALALIDLVPAERLGATTDRPDLLSAGLGAALREERIDRALTIASGAADVLEALLANNGKAAVWLSLIGFVTRFAPTARAIDLVGRISQDGAPDGNVVVPLVRMLVRAGKWEDACARLESLRPFATFEQIMLASQVALQTGRHAEAEALVGSAIPMQLKGAGAIVELAVALQANNREDDAVALLRRGLTTMPENPLLIRSLGGLLARMGTLQTEVARLGELLDRFPNDFQARLQFGLMLLEMGDLLGADAALGVLVGDRRYRVEILEQHVILRYLRMDFRGAKTLIEESGLSRAPGSNTLRRVASLLKRLTQATTTEQFLRHALDTNPNDVGVLQALGDQLLETGDPKEARALSSRVLALNPLSTRAYCLRAMAYSNEGNLNAARNALETAMFLAPGDPVPIADLALLEENAGAIEKAARLYEDSIVVSRRIAKLPSTRTLWHLVTCRMMLGDPEGAIAAHADQCSLLDQVFPQSLEVWRNQALEGRRMLIGMRGGPGDELRIANVCFPWLLSHRPAKLTFACDPRLLNLLAGSFPEIEFVPTFSGHRHLRRSDEKHTLINRSWPSLSSRITELSFAFDRVDQNDFVCHSDAVLHRVFFEEAVARGTPIERRYLTVDQGQREKMRQALGALPPGLKVGLCWRGSYFSRYRARGFLQVADLNPLMEVDGVRFVSLQANLVEEESNRFGGRLAVIPDLDLFDDFDGTAALLSELDLVISLAVTMRDVAGAVGVPTWSFTTFPGAADVWRKTKAGVDAWQPSITHYDLLSYGNRSAVVDAMADDLRKLVQAKSTIA